jgi:hypothetical protein
MHSKSGVSIQLLGGVIAYNAANVQIIQVQAEIPVTLSNFAIESGYVTGTPARGAGIHNLGLVQLNNMTLKNNLARGNTGTSGSTVRANGGVGGTAQGGAIYNAGSLQVSNSIFSANQAKGGSGGVGSNGSITSLGIFVPAGFGGTGGAAEGGAIFHQAGTLSLNNSTFGLNSAVGGNGGNGGSSFGTHTKLR